MECEIYLSKALTNKLINQTPAPSIATQVTETKHTRGRPRIGTLHGVAGTLASLGKENPS